MSRKDQVDTKENNKDIKILKDELWKKRLVTEVEIAMFRENQMMKETILLEKIWKNNIREQEVQRELEKDNSQAWKYNGVVYMEEKIYIPNNSRTNPIRKSWTSRYRTSRTTKNTQINQKELLVTRNMEQY